MLVAAACMMLVSVSRRDCTKAMRKPIMNAARMAIETITSTSDSPPRTARRFRAALAGTA